jgi:hypothetical protein
MLTTLYPQEDSLYSILLEAESGTFLKLWLGFKENEQLNFNRYLRLKKYGWALTCIGKQVHIKYWLGNLKGRH